MTALKETGLRWKLVLATAIAVLAIFLVAVAAGPAEAKRNPQYTPGYP